MLKKNSIHQALKEVSEVVEKHILTNDQFHSLLEQEMDSLKKYIEKSGASGFTSQIMVYTKHLPNDEMTGTLLVVPGFPPPPDSLLSRYDVLRMVGAKYHEKMVKERPTGTKCYPFAVFLMSEAWVRGGSKKEYDEQIKKIGRIDLGAFPDRAEGLICMGMTMDQRIAMGTFRILRDKEQHIFLTDRSVTKVGDGKMRSDALMAFYEGFVNAMNREGHIREAAK